MNNSIEPSSPASADGAAIPTNHSLGGRAASCITLLAVCKSVFQLAKRLSMGWAIYWILAATGSASVEFLCATLCTVVCSPLLLRHRFTSMFSIF